MSTACYIDVEAQRLHAACKEYIENIDAQLLEVKEEMIAQEQTKRWGIFFDKKNKTKEEAWARVLQDKWEYITPLIKRDILYTRRCDVVKIMNACNVVGAGSKVKLDIKTAYKLPIKEGGNNNYV